MKKILLVAAVAGLSMVSCKKNYTCECTTTDNGAVIGSTTATSGKIKKSEAETWCTAGASAGTAKTECKLK
jgi:subtilase family serine protease